MESIETSAAESATSTAPETALTADQIFGVDDIKYEMVPVPEWGGPVRVRGLTSDEWDAIEDSMAKVDGKKQIVSYAAFRAKVAVKGCVTMHGTPLFKDTDVTRLGAKGSAPLARVAGRILALSKVSNDDIEELVGNSSGGHSADSSTS